MNKLSKIKQWYTIDEAANRLSTSLGGTVSYNDVLRLQAEGTLSIYWRLLHQLAHQVLPDLENKKEGRPISFDDWSSTFSWKDTSNNNEYLSGIFMIDWEHSQDTRNWVYSLSTARNNFDPGPFWGTVLMDEEGNYFMLKKDYLNGSGKTEYSARVLYPDLLDILVAGSDLTLLEISAREALPISRGEISQQKEKSYLHLIGALLSYIKGNEPGTGRHPSFKSEAELREFLEERYKNIYGMSSRSLSDKFRDAKALLEKA